MHFLFEFAGTLLERKAHRHSAFQSTARRASRIRLPQSIGAESLLVSAGNGMRIGRAGAEQPLGCAWFREIRNLLMQGVLLASRIVAPAFKQQQHLNQAFMKLARQDQYASLQTDTLIAGCCHASTLNSAGGASGVGPGHPRVRITAHSRSPTRSPRPPPATARFPAPDTTATCGEEEAAWARGRDRRWSTTRCGRGGAGRP